MRVLKSTKEIVLHAKEIDFQTVTVTSAGASQDAKIALEPDSQMVRLTTPSRNQARCGHHPNSLPREAERRTARLLHRQGRPGPKNMP